MRTLTPAQVANRAQAPVMLQLNPFHEICDAPLSEIADRPQAAIQAGIVRPGE